MLASESLLAEAVFGGSHDLVKDGPELYTTWAAMTVTTAAQPLRGVLDRALSECSLSRIEAFLGPEAPPLRAPTPSDADHFLAAPERRCSRWKFSVYSRRHRLSVH